MAHPAAQILRDAERQRDRAREARKIAKHIGDRQTPGHMSIDTATTADKDLIGALADAAEEYATECEQEAERLEARVEVR